MRSRDASRELQRRTKRVIDVVVSAALLLALGPILLVTAVTIRLTSPGPAIYSGKRWGLDGRHFDCLKFRSMYRDQAAILARAGLRKDAACGELLKLRDDPRVTRVGAVLRASSIDELPQLVNVLRGEMSLVGPRPLVLHMLEPYPELRAKRNIVRPGITGLWQIRHRENNTSVHNMIDDDLEYVRDFSLLLDLKIVALTIPAILFMRGAH